jgi:hypothetical protein
MSVTTSSILFGVLISYEDEIRHWNVHDFYHLTEGLQFKVSTDYFKGHICIRYEKDTSETRYDVELGHRFERKWLEVADFTCVISIGESHENLIATLDKFIHLSYKRDSESLFPF